MSSFGRRIPPLLDRVLVGSERSTDASKVSGPHVRNPSHATRAKVGTMELEAGNFIPLLTSRTKWAPDKQPTGSLRAKISGYLNVQFAKILKVTGKKLANAVLCRSAPPPTCTRRALTTIYLGSVSTRFIWFSQGNSWLPDWHLIHFP